MTKLIMYFMCFSSVFAQTYEYQNFRYSPTPTFEARSTFGAMALNTPSTEGIYDKIESVLKNDYQNIGEKLAKKSLLNFDLGGGVKNYSGLKWNRPFANFNLYLDRSVAPDLFSENFIVRDIMTIEVKAQTLLSNLEKQGELDISQEAFAAFAGITFTRTFQAVSYSKTYAQGIVQDFNKLFFSFRKFNASQLFELSEGSHYKRVDTLSVNAGAYLSIPTNFGVSLRAGILGELSYINASGISHEEGVYKLSTEQEKILTIGARADLQLDFLNLVKASLFSFEYTYSIKTAKKLELRFSSQDRDQVLDDYRLREELELALKGRAIDSEILGTYVSLSQQTKEYQSSSQVELLLWGRHSSKSTKIYEIIKDGETRNYLSHNEQVELTRQSFFSKLFENILGIKDNDHSQSKSLSLEHLKTGGGLNVNSSEDFSLVVRSSYYAKKLNKNKVQRKAKYFLKEWTRFNDNVIELVSNGFLAKNLSIESTVTLSKENLDHFLLTNRNNFNEKADQFCYKRSKRRTCEYKLKLALRNLFRHQDKFGYINMGYFKQMISTLYNYSYKLADFEAFFSGNIHVSTELTAVDQFANAFSTHLDSGDLESKGVIADYAN